MPLEALEEALRRWLPDACSLLQKVGCHRRICEDFYVKTGPNRFERKCRERWVYVPGLEGQAFLCDSFANVVRAYNSDLRLAALNKKWVGAGTNVSKMSPQKIAMDVLPTDEDFEQPRDLATPNLSKLQERMRSLEIFLTNDSVNFLFATPVWDFDSDDSIDLEPDLWLAPMSDECITRAMRMNVIACDIRGRHYDVVRQRRFALFRRVRVPKQVSSALPQPDVSQASSEEATQYKDADRLLSVVALVAPGNSFVGGTMSWPEAGWPVPFEGTAYGIAGAQPGIDDRPRPTTPVRLDREQTDKLVRFWHNVTRVAEHDALELALRRLRFATGRANQDDRFLDLMIAAEALFIPRDSAHEELRFRTALNSAFYLHPENSISRKKTFLVMRAAYDVRSKIAHGDRPEAVKLEGREILPSELSKEAEAVVRAALQKRLNGDRRPPDYAALVMGDR